MAAAYVICGEKTELKARYHLSSGKWYSDAPVVFHVGGFYNARYYSPLSAPPPPSPPCPSRRHRRPFPPTLAGCGLHPAAFTSLFPSTYASGTDILQATLPPLSLSLSCPPSLACPSRVKPLPLIIVSEPPLITMIDSPRLRL